MRFFCRLIARIVLVVGLARDMRAQEAGQLTSVAFVGAAGQTERLSINLVRGRNCIDGDLWCGGAGIAKVEGTFEICVEAGDRESVCTPLNPLLIEPVIYGQYGHRQSDQPQLWFRDEPWTVELADYNSDGHPDFAIGQYGGCRGWDYTVLTVDASGRVRRLVADHLFVKGAVSNSTCFDLTADGFQLDSWDDSIDGYTCRQYGPNGDSHVLALVRETPGQCPHVEEP